MAQFIMTDVKTFPEMSEETTACSAKILLDGEIVGHVRNSGTGGGTYIRWNSRQAREAWEDMLRAHPLAQKSVTEGKDTWAEERILDEAIEVGGGAIPATEG